MMGENFDRNLLDICRIDYYSDHLHCSRGHVLRSLQRDHHRKNLDDELIQHELSDRVTCEVQERSEDSDD